MQCFLVIDELKAYFIKQRALKIGNALKKKDLTKAVTKLYVDVYRSKFEDDNMLTYDTIDISPILQAIRVDPIHYKDILMGKMFKYFLDKIHVEMKTSNHQDFSSKRHKQHVHKLKNGKNDGNKLDVFEQSCCSVFEKTFTSLILNKFECLENHVKTRFHIENSIGIYRSNSMVKSLRHKFQLKSFKIDCKRCENKYNVGVYKATIIKPAPILVFTMKGKSEREEILDEIDLYNHVPASGIDFDLIYELFGVIYKKDSVYEANVLK